MACASYLVGCESKGIAAVVDPDRDVRKYLETAESRGLKIIHIIETHLHADHVSGNTDLAARTGAEIYIHEASGAQFPHKSQRPQSWAGFALDWTRRHDCTASRVLLTEGTSAQKAGGRTRIEVLHLR